MARNRLVEVRSALQGLPENPLHLREDDPELRSRVVIVLLMLPSAWLLLQQPGIVVADTATHIIVWSLVLLVPALVAADLAVAMADRDRRTRFWDDVVLTALTPEEILVARLAPALEVGLLFLAIAALLGCGYLAGSGAAGWWGLRLSLPRQGALLLGTGTACAASVLAGALIGIRVGLRHRLRDNGRLYAWLWILFVQEGALGWALLLERGLTMVWPSAGPTYVFGIQYADHFWLRCAPFLLIEAVIVAAAWSLARDAVRQGSPDPPP